MGDGIRLGSNLVSFCIRVYLRNPWLNPAAALRMIRHAGFAATAHLDRGGELATAWAGGFTLEIEIKRHAQGVGADMAGGDAGLELGLAVAALRDKGIGQRRAKAVHRHRPGHGGELAGTLAGHRIEVHRALAGGGGTKFVFELAREKRSVDRPRGADHNRAFRAEFGLVGALGAAGLKDEPEDLGNLVVRGLGVDRERHLAVAGARRDDLGAGGEDVGLGLVVQGNAEGGEGERGLLHATVGEHGEGLDLGREAHDAFLALPLDGDRGLVADPEFDEGLKGGGGGGDDGALLADLGRHAEVDRIGLLGRATAGGGEENQAEDNGGRAEGGGRHGGKG